MISLLDFHCLLSRFSNQSSHPRIMSRKYFWYHTEVLFMLTLMSTLLFKLNFFVNTCQYKDVAKMQCNVYGFQALELRPVHIFICYRQCLNKIFYHFRFVGGSTNIHASYIAIISAEKLEPYSSSVANFKTLLSIVIFNFEYKPMVSKSFP